MLLTNKMTQNCMFTTTWHNHFDMLEVKPTYHKSNVLLSDISHFLVASNPTPMKCENEGYRDLLTSSWTSTRLITIEKYTLLLYDDQRSSETYRNGMARLMIDTCRLLQRTLHMITYKHSFDLQNKMQTNVA